MNGQGTSEPLACDLSALSPRERQSHQALTARLFRAAEAVDQLANGFVLRFRNDSSILLRVAEFVANEQRCCPFIDFDIQVKSRGPQLRLRLTGTKAVSEFIKIEFADLLQR